MESEVVKKVLTVSIHWILLVFVGMTDYFAGVPSATPQCPGVMATRFLSGSSKKGVI